MEIEMEKTESLFNYFYVDNHCVKNCLLKKVKKNFFCKYILHIFAS